MAMNVLQPVELKINGGQVLIYEDRFELVAGGVPIFSLPVICEVPVVGGTREDIDDPVTLAREVNLVEGGADIIWRAVSRCWRQKEYHLRVRPDGFHFTIKLTGAGRPEVIRFFTGKRRVKRPGAYYNAAGYALPVATHADYLRCTRMIIDSGEIAMGYMVPPTYVFPFWTEGIDEWVGIGLVAREGQYNFDRFQYKNHNHRCHFEVPLDGRTEVDGEWESQGIWGGIGLDAIDIVRKYSEWHYENGLCRRRDVKEERWWHGPFFCGWGEQGALAQKLGISIYDAASQALYEQMSDHLDALDLHPTAIIIDDKWQETYGPLMPDPKKWPDLRGFVDREHAKGRRVVLWIKMWNSEGLDIDECLSLWSQPIGADPTNPKYRKRIFDTFRTLLSAEEGCFDCDGFKLDFANCLANSPHIKAHEPGVYGVELLKRMFLLLYEAAKAVKPDALINCSPAHPYFAEIVDQARLHDYRDDMRCQIPVMRYRQQLYEAAIPGVLIDADSSNRIDQREMIQYVLRGVEFGVPDIYMISNTEEVEYTEEDWVQLRKIWRAYSEKVDRQFGI